MTFAQVDNLYRGRTSSDGQIGGGVDSPARATTDRQKNPRTGLVISNPRPRRGLGEEVPDPLNRDHVGNVHPDVVRRPAALDAGVRAFGFRRHSTCGDTTQSIRGTAAMSISVSEQTRTIQRASARRAPGPVAGPPADAVLDETAEPGRLQSRQPVRTRGPHRLRRNAHINVDDRRNFCAGHGGLLIEIQKPLPTRLPGTPRQEYHPACPGARGCPPHSCNGQASEHAGTRPAAIPRLSGRWRRPAGSIPSPAAADVATAGVSLIVVVTASAIMERSAETVGKHVHLSSIVVGGVVWLRSPVSPTCWAPFSSLLGVGGRLC